MVTTGTIVPIQQFYEHGGLYEMPLADLRPSPIFHLSLFVSGIDVGGRSMATF